MIHHSSWAQHLCPTHHVAVHDPTGSTVERVLSLEDGKATYTIDYHDHGTHVIIREVPERGVNPLLEEFCINDHQWLPADAPIR